MSVQFMGLSQINGPLVALDHVKNASYDEMAELILEDGGTRLGRVVQIEGERIIIQVFEGTNGLALNNTRTKLKGKPMEIPLSSEILGRIFNGAGSPIAVSYTHLDVYKRQILDEFLPESVFHLPYSERCTDRYSAMSTCLTPCIRASLVSLPSRLTFLTPVLPISCFWERLELAFYRLSLIHI